MSVSGGATSVRLAGCREEAVAVSANKAAVNIHVRMMANYSSHALPRHPEDVAHHEWLEGWPHQEPDAGQKHKTGRNQKKPHAPAHENEREERFDHYGRCRHRMRQPRTRGNRDAPRGERIAIRDV